MSNESGTGTERPGSPAGRAEIEQYLACMVKANRGAAPRLHYRGAPDFVLQHGEWFAPPVGGRHKVGLTRHCFHNAQQLCRRASALTYVEGYAFHGLLPMHHAWAVDEAGRVVDETWKWGPHEQACGALLGVRFPREVWAEAVGLSGLCTLFDLWEYKWPLLREPYDPKEPGAWLAHLRAALATPRGARAARETRALPQQPR